MGLIKGYKYTAEEDAKTACQNCNDYYGIPVSPDAVTQTWCNYSLASLNTPKFWFIVYDESLVPVLGEPAEFEVIQPTPIQ